MINPLTVEPLDQQIFDPTFIPIFQSDTDSMASERKANFVELNNPVANKYQTHGSDRKNLKKMKEEVLYAGALNR